MRRWVPLKGANNAMGYRSHFGWSGRLRMCAARRSFCQRAKPAQKVVLLVAAVGYRGVTRFQEFRQC